MSWLLTTNLILLLHLEYLHVLIDLRKVLVWIIVY
mgnify:CR=1 FL=1